MKDKVFIKIVIGVVMFVIGFGGSYLYITKFSDTSLKNLKQSINKQYLVGIDSLVIITKEPPLNGISAEFI